MSASAVEANMASGMHVFISRALQKILREAPKKHAQLRQACIEVIGALHALRRAPVAPAAIPQRWRPSRTRCSSRHARLATLIADLLLAAAARRGAQEGGVRLVPDA
jgi:hypothetical protein